MTFSLNGNFIPTDGSRHVRVTAIGDNHEDALICRSGKAISGGGNWYLHPTEMSTDDGDRIVSDGVPDRGWSRNRATDSEGHRLVRLRRASATAEEGVFTCDIPGDFGTPVSVGVYYPCESYMEREISSTLCVGYNNYAWISPSECDLLHVRFHSSVCSVIVSVHWSGVKERENIQSDLQSYWWNSLHQLPNWTWSGWWGSPATGRGEYWEDWAEYLLCH